MSNSKINQWASALLKKLFKKAVNKAAKAIKEEAKKEAKKETQKGPKKEDGKPEKPHSWRLCSIGEHWVTDHPLWIPPADKRPGYYTTRDGHCAANPMRGKSNVIKDYLTAEEMQMMADKHFSNLSGPPGSEKLPEYGVGADNFDHFIRGWTKYWNDIFKPDEPLDPDLVKALIATESGFTLRPPAPNAGSAGKAHGLIGSLESGILQVIALNDRPHGEKLSQNINPTCPIWSAVKTRIPSK